MRCKLLESQIYIASNGEYRFCCTSQEPNNKEKVWTHTPAEWLNSDTVKNAKNQLANGQWPDACTKCMIDEAAGRKSRRLDRMNYGPDISHLDLRFGNSCNLKCISCWSGSSSSINDEAAAMAEKNIIPLYPIFPQSVSNWYDEKFFTYFENMPVQEVALAGGEPMMVKHLDQFLERLDTSVTVRITTNATIYNPKLINLLKKFKKVIITLSIDAVKEKIEYIRYGSKWNDVEYNSLKYSEMFNVGVSPCISILNVLYYNDLEKWCTTNNLKLYSDNLLITPAWLNLKNAPDSLKSQMTHFVNCALDKADIIEQENFIKNIKKLDSWRNVRIQDYLPEVAKAYGID